MKTHTHTHIYVYVCIYIHICTYMSKGRKCNNKVVDEVGAVMAIKCPRPYSGPLNGVQAITIGEYMDCS